MNLSHRLRLALAATAASGLVLAGLFVAIVLFARRDVVGDKKAELAAVMRSLTPASDPRFDLDEFETTHPEMSASIFDGAGRVVGRSGRVPPPKGVGFAARGERLELGLLFKGEDVVLSLDLSEAHKGVDRLAAALAALWLPLALLVGAATWGAAQSVFRPLERLSAQALEIGGDDLSERLATPDRAEFGAFAARLNEMLDRIEETVRRGERFSADAAHEMRTPLAILRTRLETALLLPRSPDDYRRTLGRSIEEIERLTAITESLLRSTRDEPTPAEPIDLRPVVERTVDRWRERYVAQSVRLETSIAPVWAALLPDEVRVVLDNLLDNALRYAPRGSTVETSLEETPKGVRLAVRDEGPGIPPELGERVFDRFVRADDSRNRAFGGSGIGLSVCRQIVTSRGGKMILAANPGGGAEIGCLLPSSIGAPAVAHRS